jgi:hypothetical protein
MEVTHDAEISQYLRGDRHGPSISGEMVGGRLGAFPLLPMISAACRALTMRLPVASTHMSVF